MEDFKVRLLDEAQALWDKIMGLEDFISTRDEYHDMTLKQRFGLHMQLFFMRRYYFWLCNRISWHCSVDDIDEYTRKVETIVVEEKTVDVAGEKKPKTKRKTKKNTKHE